jgi:hypothetical protein
MPSHTQAALVKYLSVARQSVFSPITISSWVIHQEQKQAELVEDLSCMQKTHVIGQESIDVVPKQQVMKLVD